MAFNYLSYSGAMMVKWLYSDKETHEKLHHDLQKNLANMVDEPGGHVFDDWDIVWGPAVYTMGLGTFQDNMMYVMRQKSEPKRYVVSVRGTNPPAILDWIKEDLHVVEKKPWATPPGIESNAMISESSALGFDILLNKMKPSGGIPGDGTSIEDFMKQFSPDDGCDIYFTGHSLGGALAPVLALYFRQQQAAREAEGVKDTNAIAAIPFAGPTPGDGNFAALYNKLMDGRNERIVCDIDLVPHVWQRSDLEKLPEIYKSADIEPNWLEREALDLILDKVHGYEQMGNLFSFPGEVNPKRKSFAAQVIYQHIFSYPTYFKMPQMAKVVPLVG